VMRSRASASGQHSPANELLAAAELVRYLKALANMSQSGSPSPAPEMGCSDGSCEA
jgi:hypothetical protein